MAADYIRHIAMRRRKFTYKGVNSAYALRRGRGDRYCTVPLGGG